ncbi:MAG: hypothetical protein ABMA02_12170 [Saprospiraceae bacterium]
MLPAPTPARRYSLRFFAADAANEIRPLHLAEPGGTLVVGNEPEMLRYDALARCIADALSTKVEAFPVFSRIVPPTNPMADSDGVVDILLARTDHLCHPRFFLNLSHGPLRRTDPPIGEQSAGAKVSDFIPNPVVTLCPADLLAMYEETTGSAHETEAQTRHWQKERESRSVLYALGMDHRAKFLDASIWHRYVRTQGNWLPDFASVLTDLVRCADLYLYDAPAALATLEFSCRMLRNSFIANFSDRGHQEAVTPFKFHSETVMARKARNLQETFLGKVRENGSRLSDLRWNVLMVDDYAHRKLVLRGTTAAGQGDDIPTKKKIIEAALAVSPDWNLTDNLHIEITRDEHRVISNAIDLLKKTGGPAFDIILLDYLLGESEVYPQSGLKAYGHEFLLELATSGERHTFRRGPMGRYWIFPISSFPFAFSDKLHQMNLDSSTEQWHIASGGDPITTPALFRVNLLRLLIRQIGEFYLHEAALERWLDRFERISAKNEWTYALRRQIAADRTKSSLLALERQGGSAFGERMERFLGQQPKYALFWKNFKKWLKKLDKYQIGEPTEVLFAELDNVFPGDWERSVGDRLRRQLYKIVRDASAELEKLTCQLAVTGNNALVFKDKKLFYFPPDLHLIHTGVQVVDLSGNDLAIFSIKPDQWPDLTKLDLSGNRDLEWISVDELLKRNLIEINLSGTKISASLDRDNLSAFDTKGVRKLLKSIPHANGNASKFPLNIFIANALADNVYRDKLVAHLAVLSRHGIIDVWHEGRILPGANHAEERSDALQAAEIVLFLVSADWFADSKAAQDERLVQKRCDEGLCHAFPVFVRRCDLSGHWLGKIQGLPDGPDRPIAEWQHEDDAFAQVVAGLQKILRPASGLNDLQLLGG